MTVSFLPFPASIFGDYVMGSYQNTAVSVFCMGILLPVPVVTAVYLYVVSKHRLVDKTLSNAFIKRQSLKLFGRIAFATVALICSFFYLMVSLGFIGVQCLMFLLPPDEPVYDGE